MRRLKLVLTTAILFSCMLLSTSQAASVNQAAPDFTLKSMAGKNIKLSELAGNVILLNFWASWCGPCRTEMPLLNDLQNRYEPLGFTVLGVNVEEDSAPAKTFLSKTPVDFPILLDNRNQVSKQYDVLAMPTTVMIDRNGKVRYLHKGYQAGDEKKYKKMIKQLVRE